MNKIKNVSVAILLMILAAYFVGPVNLTAESKIEEKVNPVADVMIGSGGLTISPKVSYSQLVLTISTPLGEVISKTFNAGTTPYYELSGNEGDGSYTYELRVIPFSTKKQRESDANAGLEIARTASDRQPPLVQSGAFYVDRGSIVTPTGQTEVGIAKPLDQVILDDLIVDGSLCVGFDCVNGESFGFDTIRLKENNIRIRFMDTSNSAGFPSNDWQLTANDSSSGGANYFSIDDIDGGRTPFKIEASAPTNSLYVDDGGRVGFGTATPVAQLHVKDGNTPTLRLEQDGSSGFTPQTWDVAGNEANFFIRDATNGSELPFRIVPGAPSNTIFINSDGKIGFGTNSPGFPLHLLTGSSTNATIIAERTTGAKNSMNATDVQGNFGTISAHPLKLVTEASAKVTIAAGTGTTTDAGNVTIGGGSSAPTDYRLTVYTNHNNSNGSYGYCDGAGWLTGSSRKFKENIKDLSADVAMEAFKKLNPIRFYYKGMKEKDEKLGFIAEDVPEIVATKNRDAISAMDIVTLLTKVVQQQQDTLENQQKTIDLLKKEITELKKK